MAYLTSQEHIVRHLPVSMQMEIHSNSINN
jgi:hypothetical protein